MSIHADEATLILSACLLGSGYTRSTTGILKLYKEDGTEIGNGHTGKTFTWNGTNFTVTNNTFTNAVAITGDNNGSAAVTAHSYKIFRSNGTDVMFEDDLNDPIEIAEGAPFVVPIGEIDATFGGAFTQAWGEDWADHIATGASISLPDTDVELELVSTAPSASAAGTTVVYTGYAPLSLAVGGAVWTVTDNVAELQPDLTPAFPDVQATSTNPRGLNVYHTSVAGLRMFWVDWGSAITLNVGNRLLFDSNLDANTVKITLE